MKKALRIFWYLGKYAFLLFALLTVVSWWRQPEMPENPNLTFYDRTGQVIDLQMLSEKSPVLVYFWGTWCGVCSLTSPAVNKLTLQNYPVVSIAVQSGTDAEIDQYMQSHDYQFRVINDSDGRVFADWKGKVTPSFVVLDKGRMTQGLSGIQTAWSLKWRLWLNRWL